MDTFNTQLLCTTRLATDMSLISLSFQVNEREVDRRGKADAARFVCSQLPPLLYAADSDCFSG